MTRLELPSFLHVGRNVAVEVLVPVARFRRHRRDLTSCRPNLGDAVFSMSNLLDGEGEVIAELRVDKLDALPDSWKNGEGHALLEKS